MKHLLLILFATVASAETIIIYDSRFETAPESAYQAVDAASVQNFKDWSERGINIRQHATPALVNERVGVTITGTLEQAEADFRVARAKVSEVTPRQFKLALLATGITPDMVESALATITNDMVRIAAQIEWREALIFKRSHPLVAQVGGLLNTDEKMVDELFLAAEEIE